MGSLGCVAPPGFRSPVATSPGAEDPVADRYFSPASAFNEIIGPSATPVPDSTEIARELGRDPTADIYAYGESILTATDATPRFRVTCRKLGGSCPLSVAGGVPIPDGAMPTTGSDHSLVVVAPSEHLAYELWQARRTGDQWSAEWGAVVSTVGLGNTDVAGGPGGTGSGLSRLAGVVTISDLGRGVIPHALAFSSSLTCSSYVYPAVKSDGETSPPNCIPEGARIQLDPTIDLAAIPGITPFELMVGRALQTYGAFARDTGGASLALSFESPHSGEANPYRSLGAPYDYFSMPHLPWKALRLCQG